VLDGLATLPQFSAMSMDAVRRLQARLEGYLHELMPLADLDGSNQSTLMSRDLQYFTVGLFKLGLGPNTPMPLNFTLKAPTAYNNVIVEQYTYWPRRGETHGQHFCLSPRLDPCRVWRTGTILHDVLAIRQKASTITSNQITSKQGLSSCGNAAERGLSTWKSSND
jgi:hypothetical protein